jgi:hypothetical protein
MAESMRGSRLGWVSYERDEGVEPAERHYVTYRCPSGHRSLVPFAAEAEDLPREWSCRCGAIAEIDAPSTKVATPVERVVRPTRTHWDMLLERRSIAELEELLEERLALLHAGELSVRRSA